MVMVWPIPYRVNAKFVPSLHPGPFAVVASSRKSQTKVGTLACFDFFVKE